MEFARDKKEVFLADWKSKWPEYLVVSFIALASLWGAYYFGGVQATHNFNLQAAIDRASRREDAEKRLRVVHREVGQNYQTALEMYGAESKGNVRLLELLSIDTNATRAAIMDPEVYKLIPETLAALIQEYIRLGTLVNDSHELYIDMVTGHGASSSPPVERNIERLHQYTLDHVATFAASCKVLNTYLEEIIDTEMFKSKESKERFRALEEKVAAANQDIVDGKYEHYLVRPRIVPSGKK